jgi:hypothetical protein
LKVGYKHRGVLQFERAYSDYRGLVYFRGPTLPDRYQVSYLEAEGDVPLAAQGEVFNQPFYIDSDYVIGPTKDRKTPQIKVDLEWASNPQPFVGDRIVGQKAIFKFSDYKYGFALEYGIEILNATASVALATASASPIEIQATSLATDGKSSFNYRNLKYSLSVRSKGGLNAGTKFIPIDWVP